MGLALGVCTIAALFLGARANFDPTIGPGRLIFAFEAVIIGGLGSLWGTLAGGVVLGIAQVVGAALNPEWQLLAGHLAFLAMLVARPRGLFPQSRAMTTARYERADVRRRPAASRRARAPGIAAGGESLRDFVLRRAAVLRRSRPYSDPVLSMTMLALAQYWNLLAGYAGWFRSDNRPSSGLADISCSRSRPSVESIRSSPCPWPGPPRRLSPSPRPG